MAEIAMPKPRQQVEIEIDDRKVLIKRIPVRRYDWDHTGRDIDKDDPEYGSPKDQSTAEIWIDGDLIGLACRAHGWGKRGWSILRLGEEFGDLWHCCGEIMVFPDPLAHYGDKREALLDAEAVARKALSLRDDGKLRTMPEWNAEIERIKAMRAERARKDAEDQARWKREREARKVRDEEQRQDILAGLRSMRDRNDLSNLEAAALQSAIERYEKGFR